MRILVHDYSGHPFQVDLSRKLAARGHRTLHVHCSSYETGKGAVTRAENDHELFDVASIDLGSPFPRYRYVRRARQELRYGAAFAEHAARFRPDVVLSSNDPLFAKARAARWCERNGTPWVFWLQDVYSVAMAGYVRDRLPVVGAAAGRGFQALERRLLRSAAAVVPITEDFLPLLDEWGIALEKCTVVENWSPVEEIPLLPKENAWSREHGLDRRRVLLYAGTLGLKHDPALLVALARRFEGEADVAVVVVSEGAGATWLQQQKAAHSLDNLVVLRYQPWERMPEVFASADILLTILEPQAGVFSVPSKVLTYLCAGRAILGSMPAENLAARTLVRAGAGMVVPPGDHAAFTSAATLLAGDEATRREMGRRGRRYAEAHFNTGAIVDTFERILAQVAAKSATTDGAQDQDQGVTA